MTTPQPASGGFQVNVDGASQAITELEDALAELMEIRQQATLLGTVNPSSRDQVSIDAAQLLGRSAVGDEGSLINALNQGIQQIESTISALRESLRTYAAGDAQSAADLR